MTRTLALLILSLALASPAPAADWPTHRAGPQRVGSLDDKPVPANPTILWTYPSAESFIASPVTDGKALFVSGLGSFNTASLIALPLDGRGTVKELWAKRAPAIKQPVASSPAVAGGRLVFGDGMHQNDGGTLHCLTADAGKPVWQLPVGGALVHLEGAPAISGDRVVFTAGAAGVLCVDARRLTLNGRETDAAAVQKLIEAEWAKMAEQYEKDKAKDPDFAIPPSEDALPKAQPKLLWQAGKGAWHVDAPPAIVGDSVLVASAFLDAERVGKRALLCLDLATGDVKWTAQLALNPWGGPAATGDLVLVGCSSIRYEPRDLPGKGQVVALNLRDGSVKWSKDVPGGVVSPVVAAGGLAVFAAGDGVVRAFDLNDGSQRWAAKLKAPAFAAPAVAGGQVYVADLKANVAAFNLADGKPLWSLDLAAHDAVGPGSVYGSPIVHGGRLYLATCNLDAAGQARTAVVCIGSN